jgi:cardiolipin synthase A/B
MTYSSAKTNREYIATDLDPQDVADAETIFDADFRNVTPHLPTTKLLLSPQNATGVDARTRLRALIDSATTSLDVEAQSLSDDTLVDGIVAAHQASVAVRVVLDGDTLNTTGQHAALAKLKAAGVPVRTVASPDIHAKAIVVDEAHTFVGSMNLTPTALVANREMGIVTDAKAEATKVRKTIAEDFAQGQAP